MRRLVALGAGWVLVAVALATLSHIWLSVKNRVHVVERNIAVLDYLLLNDEFVYPDRLPAFNRAALLDVIKEFGSNSRVLADRQGRLLNPYTGKPMREVPIDKPSPGDYAYLPLETYSSYADGHSSVETDDYILIGFTPGAGPWLERSEANQWTSFCRALGGAVFVDPGRGSKRTNTSDMADPDSAPLFSQHETIAEALLRLGYGDLARQVDPSVTADSRFIKARGDWQRAVWERRWNGMSALLAFGIDIDTPLDDGGPALHYAANSLDVELAKWLLDHGAGVNNKNVLGETPLHIALRTHMAVHFPSAEQAVEATANDANRRPFVELLLAHGADAGLKDAGGASPRDLAPEMFDPRR